MWRKGNVGTCGTMHFTSQRKNWFIEIVRNKMMKLHANEVHLEVAHSMCYDLSNSWSEVMIISKQCDRLETRVSRLCCKEMGSH